MSFIEQVKKVNRAQQEFAFSTGAQRNRLLKLLAESILKNQKQILTANLRDMRNFENGSPMKDRSVLNAARIKALAASLRAVAKLPDPSNRVLEQKKLANGLALRKVSVPLGTVAVIYESRPNVTVDIAALAFKSGNGVVLKGGTESYETNKQLVQIIKQVLAKSGFSWDLIYLINPADNWKKELFTTTIWLMLPVLTTHPALTNA